MHVSSFPRHHTSRTAPPRISQRQRQGVKERTPTEVLLCPQSDILHGLTLALDLASDTNELNLMSQTKHIHTYSIWRSSSPSLHHRRRRRRPAAPAIIHSTMRQKESEAVLFLSAGCGFLALLES